MLCRTVPIAKGNTEKVAMARFTRSINLDNMVPRSYWVRRAGGM